MSDTRSEIVAVTPTITAGAYSTGDAVGGLLTFTDILEGLGKSGLIHTVSIVDKAAQLAQLELVLFDQSFTAAADNAAFDPSDADLANCIGVVPIYATDYFNFTDNAIAVVRNVGLVVDLQQSSTDHNLYGQLVVRGTPTYASTSDIIVKLHVLQD